MNKKSESHPVKRELTLRGLERAAMRWYRGCKKRGYTEEGATLLPATPLSKLFIACARHAAARKKERK